MANKPAFFSKPDKPSAADPQPQIKQLSTMLLPVSTGMQQGFVSLLYGLGEDNRVYQWMGDLKAWILA